MERTLGQTISERRQELGRTQREMARAVGISNSTVSRIESDDGICPDNNTLKKISEYLQMDYNFLLALNNQIDDDPDIRRIQRAAKNMSAEQKESMMGILQAVFKDAFEKAGGDKKNV